MKKSRLLIAVALGLGLTLTLLWMLRQPPMPASAASDRSSAPLSLTREYDPVSISGAALSDLIGSPLDEIFVYVYRDTSLVQIPFQIDERARDGMYVPLEDGLLDGNDELVFMAIDGGGWIDPSEWNSGNGIITPTYIINLTDPLSGKRAWAYIVRSDELIYSVTTDYVSYDHVSDRITSPGWYVMGFDADHGFLDYLTLGGSGQELLDRSKLRVSGTFEIYGSLVPFSFTEQDITRTGVHAIDGPVRVTWVCTNSIEILPGLTLQGSVTLFAYRSLAMLPRTITVPGYSVQVNYLRLSTDWNEQARGMVFYDANNSVGVTVDGNPDVVTSTPLAQWTQVTSVTGGIVNVSEIPDGLGGVQSTYYKDDSTVDSNDTGDQRSYGDAGLQIAGPNPGIYTLLGQIYFLTGTTANVGQTYADYYDNPIQVTVEAFPSQHYVYLPVLTRATD